MKYILLVGDGMADRPIEELNGKTILEAAHTPNMDEIVKQGRIGIVKTIPRGMTPASDVANLAIMGYDPKVYYRGRGPLEAANMGIPVKSTEVVFRCNTVTVSEGKMVDYSAGHIKTKESVVIIEELAKKLGTPKIKFYPGISYRHLVVVDAGTEAAAEQLNNMKCTPPHDITGKNIQKYLPKGEGAEAILDLMEKSKEILLKNDINKVRIDLGENPANMIWLWGQGVKPNMPLFKELFGISGSVISAVDLVNGIGKLVGLKVINVPGATGYYDTNFKGKADYALESLKNNDFVFVHVEAPDEAGHNGDIRAKVGAVENFDRLVVGTILQAVKQYSDGYRILVLPDHATPVSIKTHTSEPVPFAVCGDGITPDNAAEFTEKAASESEFELNNASGLMKYLVKLDYKQ